MVIQTYMQAYLLSTLVRFLHMNSSFMYALKCFCMCVELLITFYRDMKTRKIKFTPFQVIESRLNCPELDLDRKQQLINLIRYWTHRVQKQAKHKVLCKPYRYIAIHLIAACSPDCMNRKNFRGYQYRAESKRIFLLDTRLCLKIGENIIWKV